MKLFHRASKELKRHMTVMLLPHNTVRPLRITFTLSFLLFMILGWTALTIWAGYVSSKQIDYWKMQTDTNLMKLKVTFFAKQIQKSNEMLEQVKENDQQIRQLLEMKSKRTIIDNDTEGRGGPTKDDLTDLSRTLNNKLDEMSQEDIHRQTDTLTKKSREALNSYKEVLSYVDEQRCISKATPRSWPCIGSITSTFGFRVHPIYTNYEFHAGLDIANAKNTPIYATAYGAVKLADWQSGYGRLIIVDNGYGYQTYYGHLEKILVRQGETIRRGQLIGLMGNTGSSTGSHLHYEVQYNNQPTNPAAFIKELRENKLTRG